PGSAARPRDGGVAVGSREVSDQGTRSRSRRAARGTRFDAAKPTGHASTGIVTTPQPSRTVAPAALRDPESDAYKLPAQARPGSSGNTADRPNALLRMEETA